MKIGIVGAGSMGTALARRLLRLEHEVTIATTRGSTRLVALASEIGVTPAAVADAVEGAQVVILAIPTLAVPALPQALFASLGSTVVIDIANYHPELRDGRIDAIDQGLLDSQWVAQQIAHPVVKAFNTIFARSLLEKGTPKGTPGRIALPVAGDSADSTATVRRLVDDLGFDAIDAGTLDDSWRQGTGTPAYCKDLDAGALRRALAAADRSQVTFYRAQEEARIRRALRARQA